MSTVQALLNYFKSSMQRHTREEKLHLYGDKKKEVKK